MGVVIHVIKRNGKHEFRCGNNTSDSYFLSSVEEPFDDLDEAVANMVNWQAEHKYGVSDDPDNNPHFYVTETREEAKKGWTQYLKQVIGGGNKGTFFDLDAYHPVAKSIIESRTKFPLDDKEVGVLRGVSDYLMNERKLPLEKRDLSGLLPFFKRTIEKLTDCESIDAKPHPSLRPEEVAILNGTYEYVRWLDRTYGE